MANLPLTSLGDAGTVAESKHLLEFGDRFPDLSRHRGRRPVPIDDIARSGRTLVAAAEQLVAKGFPAPDCVVVHAIFGGEAFGEVSAVAGRVVSTDSVPHASNALPLAALIAQALGAAEPAPG